MPIRLHNVLMRPGLEISGCAEPALVVSAKNKPVISVPSSPGKVDEEDGSLLARKNLFSYPKRAEMQWSVSRQRSSQTPPLIVPIFTVL